MKDRALERYGETRKGIQEEEDQGPVMLKQRRSRGGNGKVKRKGSSTQTSQ